MTTIQQVKNDLNAFKIKDPQSSEARDTNMILHMIEKTICPPVLDEEEVERYSNRMISPEKFFQAIQYLEAIELQYTFSSETLRARLQREGHRVHPAELTTLNRLSVVAKNRLNYRYWSGHEPSTEETLLKLHDYFIKKIPAKQYVYHGDVEENAIKTEAIEKWREVMHMPDGNNRQGIQDIKRDYLVNGKGYSNKSDEEIKSAVNRLVAPDKLSVEDMSPKQKLQRDYILRVGQDINRFVQMEFQNEVRLRQEDGSILNHALSYMKCEQDFNWRRDERGEIVGDLYVEVYTFWDPEDDKHYCVDNDGRLMFSNDPENIFEKAATEKRPVFSSTAQVRLDVVYSDVTDTDVVPVVTAFTTYTNMDNLQLYSTDQLVLDSKTEHIQLDKDAESLTNNYNSVSELDSEDDFILLPRSDDSNYKP